MVLPHEAFLMCLPNPVLTRYVDDFFSVDVDANAQPSMEIFARLVRVCLGSSAIAQRKLQHGNPLTILGVDVEINQQGIGNYTRTTTVLLCASLFCEA